MTRHKPGQDPGVVAHFGFSVFPAAACASRLPAVYRVPGIGLTAPSLVGSPSSLHRSTDPCEPDHEPNVAPWASGFYEYRVPIGHS